MSSQSPSDLRRSLLRRLLGPMWLRPESALWYSHEGAAVRELLRVPLPGPSLEFGCMEGVSSLAMMGGAFPEDFDVYEHVDAAPDAEDRFDVSPGDAEPLALVREPEDRFAVGLSWKQAHLEKAARLRLHERLVLADPNEPQSFADEAFATIWAPNLYWVDRLADLLLPELRRMLRPDGRLVTVLPDAGALEHSLTRLASGADPVWIAGLDRGRAANIGRQARSAAEWKEVFEGAGLRIERHLPFLPALIFRVNDIGLRPLFPVLMEIRDSLSPEQLTGVRRDWTELLFTQLAPLCDTEWMAGPRVWHAFALVPASA
jgi:SAM-dependent methyltransferase